MGFNSAFKGLNKHVNEEECKLTVQTQLYLKSTISYMFRLYTAIIRLNTEP